MRKRSPLLVAFLTVFIDLVGFGIIIPLQPFYVDAAGGSGAAVGALFAAYSFAQFLFVPIWGRVSDRVGRRPVILLTLVGTGVSFLVFAGAIHSLFWLFAARIAAGIFGANLATARAYVADVTPPEERARGMGLIGAAFGMGFVLGPAIGGALALLGPAWPPAVAGVLALANAAFALVALPESRPVEARGTPAPWRWFDPQGMRAARRQPVLGVLFLILFLGTFAFSNLETTFSLLLHRNLHYGRSQASLLFVYIGVISAIVQGGLLGRLSRRFGPPRLIVAGTALLAVGLAVLPWTSALGGVLGLCAGVAVGSSLNRPAINALVSILAGEGAQGALLGTASSLSSLARMVGPALGGVLWDVAWHLPYDVGAGVMAVASVMALGVAPRLMTLHTRATADLASPTGDT